MQGVDRPKAARLLRLGLFSLVLALGGCGARNLLRNSGLEGRSNAAANHLNVKVTADVSKTHPVAANLWGIFFEEIQHAGEGGLYAELVQDRSFDGLAYTQAFLDSDASELILGPTAFEGSHLSVVPAAQSNDLPVNQSLHGITAQLYQHNTHQNAAETSQPVSWRPIGDTQLTLTKQYPLNGGNKIAMRLDADSGAGGIINTGFWGISVAAGEHYELSLYLRKAQPSSDSHISVEVALESAHGSQLHASIAFDGISADWQQYRATLKANATDTTARLAVRLQQGAVLLGMVSLFPAENGVEGSVSPFRSDILSLLKGLKPRFLRFPGGCYVEGVTLANAFYWKPSVGPLDQRPGHWNGMWQYWSTDGLGLYEYMLLSEELGTEPIWVLNNGLSHQESVPTARIQGMVQDALDSIEFITGSASTQWGGLRARMGHPDPWALTYIGIGNEDCGKPFYTSNYLAFFYAIKERYPDMQLIANCDMGDDAPTEIWDWHWYTDPDSMFNGRYTFDSMSVAKDSYVFASEYAVFDWGIPTIPRGNIQGAIAEAAFMTGMERNSEVVQLAAYAPLLANVNHKGALCPTNLVIYDNSRAFGNPSYHVQALFAQHQGLHYVQTDIDSRSARDNGVAASATCQDDSCSRLSVKLVNYAQFAQTVALRIKHSPVPISAVGNVTVLTGLDYQSTNSFEDPHNVYPRTGSFKDMSSEIEVELAAFSLTVIATAPASASPAVAQS